MATQTFFEIVDWNAFLEDAFIIPEEGGSIRPAKEFPELVEQHEREWANVDDVASFTCITCRADLPLGWVHYGNCDAFVAIWH